MIRYLLKSKIHRATVTEARLDYVGSITIDADMMDMADISVHEKVLVADIDNGQRFETYAIPGPRGSRVVCMNGAAARLVQPGDKIIVMTFGGYEAEEARNHHPLVVLVDEGNEPIRSGREEPDPDDPQGSLV